MTTTTRSEVDGATNETLPDFIQWSAAGMASPALFPLVELSLALLSASSSSAASVSESVFEQRWGLLVTHASGESRAGGPRALSLLLRAAQSAHVSECAGVEALLSGCSRWHTAVVSAACVEPFTAWARTGTESDGCLALLRCAASLGFICEGDAEMIASSCATSFAHSFSDEHANSDDAAASGSSGPWKPTVAMLALWAFTPTAASRDGTARSNTIWKAHFSRVFGWIVFLHCTGFALRRSDNADSTVLKKYAKAVWRGDLTSLGIWDGDVPRDAAEGSKGEVLLAALSDEAHAAALAPALRWLSYRGGACSAETWMKGVLTAAPLVAARRLVTAAAAASGSRTSDLCILADLPFGNAAVWRDASASHRAFLLRSTQLVVEEVGFAAVYAGLSANDEEDGDDGANKCVWLVWELARATLEAEEAAERTCREALVAAASVVTDGGAAENAIGLVELRALLSTAIRPLISEYSSVASEQTKAATPRVVTWLTALLRTCVDHIGSSSSTIGDERARTASRVATRIASLLSCGGEWARVISGAFGASSDAPSAVKASPPHGDSNSGRRKSKKEKKRKKKSGGSDGTSSSSSFFAKRKAATAAATAALAAAGATFAPQHLSSAAAATAAAAAGMVCASSPAVQSSDGPKFTKGDAAYYFSNPHDLSTRREVHIVKVHDAHLGDGAYFSITWEGRTRDPLQTVAGRLSVIPARVPVGVRAGGGGYAGVDDSEDGGEDDAAAAPQAGDADEHGTDDEYEADAEGAMRRGSDVAGGELVAAEWGSPWTSAAAAAALTASLPTLTDVMSLASSSFTVEGEEEDATASAARARAFSAASIFATLLTLAPSASSAWDTGAAGTSRCLIACIMIIIF